MNFLKQIPLYRKILWFVAFASCIIFLGEMTTHSPILEKPDPQVCLEKEATQPVKLTVQGYLLVPGATKSAALTSPYGLYKLALEQTKIALNHWPEVSVFFPQNQKPDFVIKSIRETTEAPQVIYTLKLFAKACKWKKAKNPFRLSSPAPKGATDTQLELLNRVEMEILAINKGF